LSVIKTRSHQLFPVLDGTQIDTAKHFASGPERKFESGEIVYDAGERDVPTWLVLKGSIAVVRRDGLNHETTITNLAPGQFSGEVNQLAGAATLATASAGPEGCTALPFDAMHVRALSAAPLRRC
jgi:thioredoxin reductase (NADPH)